MPDQQVTRDPILLAVRRTPNLCSEVSTSRRFRSLFRERPFVESSNRGPEKRFVTVLDTQNSGR